MHTQRYVFIYACTYLYEYIHICIYLLISVHTQVVQAKFPDTTCSVVFNYAKNQIINIKIEAVQVISILTLTWKRIVFPGILIN